MRSHGARCPVCFAGEFTASSDIILVNRRADQAANLTTIEEEHPETARLRPTTRGFRCLTVSHHVRGLMPRTDVQLQFPQHRTWFTPLAPFSTTIRCTIRAVTATLCCAAVRRITAPCASIAVTTVRAESRIDTDGVLHKPPKQSSSMSASVLKRAFACSAPEHLAMQCFSLEEL